MLELEKATSRSEKDDEIDLIELLIKTFLFLKKYLVLLIVLTIAGILVGILLYAKTPFYYQSRMIANSSALYNAEVANIIETWQVHITKGDYEILAKKLNLDISIVSKINSFKVSDTESEETKRIIPPEAEDGSFTIEVIVSDVQVLDSLENAIINFLENNKYIQIRSELKKANLQRLKSRIDAEIMSLDSLKLSLNNLLSNGRSTTGTFLANPADVNLSIIAMYEKALNLETSINLIDDVQIVESFTKSNTPDGPYLLKFVAIGGVSGIVIAFFTIFVLFMRNKAKAFT